MTLLTNTSLKHSSLFCPAICDVEEEGLKNDSRTSITWLGSTTAAAKPGFNFRKHSNLSLRRVHFAKKF
jgi:hypothetical protein